MDVQIIRNQFNDRPCGIRFRDVDEFDWTSAKRELEVWFETEAGMDWHRLRTVVEQEAAAEDAP